MKSVELPKYMKDYYARLLFGYALMKLKITSTIDVKVDMPIIDLLGDNSHD